MAANQQRHNLLVLRLTAYGKTIQPFHQIPAGDQEGGGQARSTEEKSNY